MTPQVLGYQSRGVQPIQTGLTVVQKLYFSAFGVLLPIICFITAARGYLPEPEWQTGEWNRYLLFVPDGRVGYPFFPLLIFSIVCLCLLMIRAEFASRLWVRIGLYTGVVLSLQYSFIQASVFNDHLTICLVIGLGSNLIVIGTVLLLNLIPRVAGKWVLAAFALYVAFWIAQNMIDPRGFLWPPLAESHWIKLLIIAPAWSVGVYSVASLIAWRANRGDESAPSSAARQAASWIGWLIAYLAAWKWSIANAVTIYATLPKTAPGCYIATAAAAGHRRFVGSRPVRLSDGSICWINPQLERLKCVEIALKTVCPSAHGLIRSVYDVIGPRMARTVRIHPLLADIAYVLIKPFEWLMFEPVRMIVPGLRELSRSIYRNSSERAEISGSRLR